MQHNYDIEVSKYKLPNFRILISYEVVYIDLDDKIIVKNALYSQMINFLYYCRKKNKKIFLITKHRDTVKNTLENFKLSSELFDEIMHLEVKKEKSNFIEKKNSIFIDNSYNERKKVKEVLKIPVFDVNMIEGLM